jgi:hypothetical protein
MASDNDDVPTMSLHLKAPVELFERLDRWCEQWKLENNRVMTPSRPAAIRWIVHNFLLKQEQRGAKAKRAKRPQR